MNLTYAINPKKLKNFIITIKGIKYKVTDDVPRKGNKVLDLRDGRWAWVFMKHRGSNHIAIGPIKSFAEVGVPIKHVRCLKRIKK